MRILKLHGHSGNTGGIVSFMHGLVPHNQKSKYQYIHFRTGKVQDSKYLSQPFIRLLEQLISYIWFPFFLLLKKPDVIEINSSLKSGAFKRDYIYAKLAALFMPQSKLVLFNHGWEDEVFDNLMAHKNKKLCSYFSCFDVIIVLTRAAAAEIKRTGFSGRTYVLTTGVNLAEFSDTTTTDSTDQTVQLLFLSRIEKAKGIGELLSAIPQIIALYPEVRTMVAGEGDWLEQAKAKATSLGISDQVDFVGYIRGQDKIDLLASSDIYVFPSYTEGCPVSVLEALAAGLPIIYTQVGALPDILSDAVNGLAIAKKSPDDIARAVIQLIENPDSRKQMRKNNMQLSQSFDLSEIHRKLEVIYTAHD